MLYILRLITYLRWSIIYFLGSSVIGHAISMDMMTDNIFLQSGCLCEDNHEHKNNESQHSKCSSIEDSKISIFSINDLFKSGTDTLSFYKTYSDLFIFQFQNNLQKNILVHHITYHPPNQKYLSYSDLIGISILLS